MSRRAVLLAVVAAVLGVSSASVQATPPTPPPPVVITTAPPTLAPPATTIPPASTSTPATTAPATTSTTPERARVIGDDDSWSVRRIATIIGISVVVLAITGFVYGRVRSHRPATATSSALATTATNPPPE